MRRAATCSAVIIFEQGIKITPFVNPWSTITKRESSPLTIGRSVIISMEQLANGLVVWAPSVGMYAGCEGCQLILNCWQIAHPFT